MNNVFFYFLITVLIINLSPGPAMMFVLQQSQRNGIRTGLSAALGVEVGVFIYVILTALGISAIFKQYPAAYKIVQLIGAAYLIYIAYLCWPRNNKSTSTSEPRSTHKGVFIKGVFINLTNPKIALFFLSLIPQFVPSNSHAMTFILYGMIFNIGGIMVNSSAALLADRITRVLKNARWFDYVPPILFVAIAIISIKARLL
jgi:threonine/homoserine/homoserine lactone efflux protein